ncbi:MAG TPA: anaerobic ribonucleoside-triphosphate reductase [Nitrosopumilaceae archaeon]|nr:anaerobic ribonucleoside-triphosphate reductase [Nitrosopumilaceae archaeon]
MEVSEDLEEQKRGGILASASKRVRMIFSVMASPNRIDILRILNSKGPLTYSELKSLAGFKSKKESGKFAYHLRKLLRQSLVALNKSERRYTITNLGKLVLSLARQIEERSIIESGKMYVRTSHEAIEEFNSHKIIQSLVREGSLPLELAQKITEEVENRIYKFQTAYLTASLIREMVNSVLLEHGHEDYRHKLARFGLPAYDIREMITNVDGIHNGVEGLLFKTGQTVFGDHLVLNTLPKDVADSHLSGDIHITSTGIWSLLPDTIFVNIKELIEDGIDLRGKFLGVTRLPPVKTLDDLITSLSLLTSLLFKEASQEVIIDGLPTVLQKYSKNLSEVEEKIASAFAATSSAPQYNKHATLLSFRISLGTDSNSKIIAAMLAGYKKYVKSTPIPHIGLIIDYEKGKVSEFSTILSEIIALGGRMIFTKGAVMSNKGILRVDTKTTGTTVINLQSLSINLPRLAFESNKDETYFRARLALLMKPALAAMSLRKKEITDLTRRGLNPILANNTQYMQKSSITLVVNLIGLKEAVFGILGYKDNKAGQEILMKVIETSTEVAAKKGKEMGDNVTISMSESDAAARFSTLDGEKYGKMSVLQYVEGDSYSEGMALNASEIDGMTLKTDKIVECNHISKMLNGGLLIQLKIPDGTDTTGIKKAIEKASELVGSFRPVRKVPICGNCGLKDEKLTDKCPTCKSPYVLT